MDAGTEQVGLRLVGLRHCERSEATIQSQETDSKNIVIKNKKYRIMRKFIEVQMDGVDFLNLAEKKFNQKQFFYQVWHTFCRR
jgi:hypothetical protein